MRVTNRHLAVDSVCIARQSAVHHHLPLQLRARGPASVFIVQHWRFGRGIACRNKACSALRSQMCRVFLHDRNKLVMLLRNDGVRALYARRREQACPIHWRRCEPSITTLVLDRSAHFAVVAQMGFRDRIAAGFRFLADQPEAKTLIQAAQFASTLLFVVLYIWSTYSPPPLWSIRYNLDLFLCVMFAIDYTSRFLVRTAHPPCYASTWQHASILVHLPLMPKLNAPAMIPPLCMLHITIAQHGSHTMILVSVSVHSKWCLVYIQSRHCLSADTIAHHRKQKTSCGWSPVCGACWTSVRLLRHW